MALLNSLLTKWHLKCFDRTLTYGVTVCTPYSNSAYYSCSMYRCKCILYLCVTRTFYLCVCLYIVQVQKHLLQRECNTSVTSLWFLSHSNRFIINVIISQISYTFLASDHVKFLSNIWRHLLGKSILHYETSC